MLARHACATLGRGLVRHGSAAAAVAVTSTAVCCARRVTAAWQGDMHERIIRERERAAIAKTLPATVVVAGGATEPVHVAYAVTPAVLDEILDQRVAATESASAEGPASHEDAQEAFDERRRATEVLRVKQADRREARARWLLWQASQREKGFEQRVRRDVERQAAARRAHYAAVGHRYLNVGRAVRREGGESGAAAAAASGVGFGGDASLDGEYDDLMCVQRGSWGADRAAAEQRSSQNSFLTNQGMRKY